MHIRSSECGLRNLGHAPGTTEYGNWERGARNMRVRSLRMVKVSTPMVLGYGRRSAGLFFNPKDHARHCAVGCNVQLEGIVGGSEANTVSDVRRVVHPSRR